MRRKRRDVPVFGLSFLDCICCGFGAAVLLFMLVDHARIDRNLTDNSEMIAKVDVLEDQLLDDKQDILAMRAALDDTVDATENASKEAQRLRELIEQLKSEAPDGEAAATTREAKIQQLQDELLALESRVQAMRAASKDASGDSQRTVAGEGRRQYLEGLDVSGRHILILVDTSASMLSETIVDAVRRRNMDDARKQGAPKWRRTVATLDWLTAQIEPTAKFQVIGFAQTARGLLGPATQWLDAAKLDDAVQALRKTSPGGGTNLSAAFAAIGELSPAPDNVYLITDGLPTQGRSGAGSGSVSGKQRVAYFQDALAALPRGVPVNTILLPMEGDPRASSLYWGLAQLSSGSLLVPSKDWP